MIGSIGINYSTEQRQATRTKDCQLGISECIINSGVSGLFFWRLHETVRLPRQIQYPGRLLLELVVIAIHNAVARQKTKSIARTY